MFGSDDSTDCLLGLAFEVEAEVLSTSASELSSFSFIMVCLKIIFQ